MVKSETRKVMLEQVKKSVGIEAYDKDHVILDTLTENRNRNHIGFKSQPGRGKSDRLELPLHKKVPLTMSLIDGSVKIVQYISANSLPHQKGIDIDEFIAHEQKMEKTISDAKEHGDDDADERGAILSDSLWCDDSDYLDISVLRNESPSKDGVREKSSKYTRARSIDGSRISETWHGLVKTFMSQIQAELMRLSPSILSSSFLPSTHYFDKSIPKGAKIDRPCLAPVVVIGFDKGSENIKADTHAKRAQDKARSLASMQKKDTENGFETQRGLPVDWEWISSDSFVAHEEKLPYPPPLLLQGDNKRKAIRFISTQLVKYAREGILQAAILKTKCHRRRHRIVQIILDGHCMYPTDDEDLSNQVDASEIGDKFLYVSKMTQYDVKRREDLPHGVDSPICDTPVSIIILFDDKDCILNQIEKLIDCPACDVATWMNVPDANGTDNGYVTAMGKTFCSTSCERYTLLKRRVMAVSANYPSSSKSSKDDSDDDDDADLDASLPTSHDTTTPTYYFIGTQLPPKILRFMQHSYEDAPEDLMTVKPNSIGEFDFTTFHYLHRLVQIRAYQALATKFVFPEDHVSSSNSMLTHRESVGVRIVTVDTDAFVLGMMATEILPKTLGINVSIFLVNNSSPDAWKKAALRKDISKATPPFTIFVISEICSVFKSMFPYSTYPASSLAMSLYFKENDYLSPALRGATISRMCDTHIHFSQRYGPNLIIDPVNHRRQWMENNGSNLPSATVIIDANVLRGFVNHIIDYAANRICPVLNNTAQPDKIRKQAVAPLGLEEMHTRSLQLLYILEIYADAILGKYNDNRTIHHTLAPKYGF